jgi:hypothetical protein
VSDWSEYGGSIWDVVFDEVDGSKKFPDLFDVFRSCNFENGFNSLSG